MTSNAFEKIYRAHFDSVYRYLLRLCRNRQVAEEITSETFFKAMSAVDKFDGKCSLETWLCQIAKNTYYTYLDKNRRQVGLGSVAEPEDPGAGLEERLCDADISERIFKALHRLEEPYKEVFCLRALGELSFRQIAGLYNRTENWACVIYHRARKKIQAILEEEK